ncbi:DEAD/DEAH box helicase family protein [Paenibacillus alkaliterrae]|uniref:DEAD/DEAH box helicase n=1 Tax=Paenibacillus alkaliterrae TaxID=320909 RepID=UPI001F3B73EC|nr:helicase-related protein [Paenibacillus alkaliterrae]MCF2941377.1 DEAD/DEAH box helicase family protein [Paenibacillus alkaliterrae]
MRAFVYAVEAGGRWQAGVTIQPAVDKRFWMDGRFGGAGRLNESVAGTGWLWKEELPLGDACLAAEIWAESGMGVRGESEALRALAECVEKVKREVKEGKREKPAGWVRRFVSWRKRQGEDKEGRLLEMAERWERAGDSCGGAVRADSDAEVSGERGGARRAEEGGERRGAVERAYSDAELGELAAGAKLAAVAMKGRALLRGEAHALLFGAGGPGAAASWSGVLQLAALLGRVRLSGSVAAGYGGRADARGRRRRERRCLRCGSGEAFMRRTACAACGRVCAYCAACIGMGRSRECELLVIGQRGWGAGAEQVSGKLMPVEQRLAGWKLSPAQTAAAREALQFVEKNSSEQARNVSVVDKAAPIRNFLLWAVTGAGKTEMIFPLVESVLLRGGRALIATPRRDVVIELDPRIRKAFPQAAVVTLYGGSEQRWESGDITLSTTHQLLRFYQGFDLVIVDEIDAFPYHGDKILHYAADKSCAPGAARLLLSATPPSELQRAARRGKLPHARVPVRYHRHPLPVPMLLQTPAVKQMLQQRKLPAKLLAAMRQSLLRDAQLFVFVQQIAQTEPMAALLRAALQHAAVAATSSQDAERADKVQRFRARNIRVLVTTTILERGVTIPKSDVYILDADGRLFDEASLVQMAGRAGRSADDPYGRVYFCSRERNHSQVSAVKHIRTMNRMARKQGFLLPTSKGGSTP